MRRTPVLPAESAFRLWCNVTGALCAFLLLCGPSWPASVGDTKHTTAVLLIANGIPSESDFADSVVLVMNNIGPAPFGIIVNRPTQIPVSDLFPDLKGLAKLHDKVYFGGPVEVESIWFLFRAVTAPAHAIQVFDGVCLSADRDVLLALLARDKPMDGLRIFAGYSGWGPGQLENEIDRGDWTPERADSDAIFNGKSEHPWPNSTVPKSRI
jgi:putative transcriptional regulator